VDGQFYQIKIKKECIDIRNNKPPSFHLWAKDRDELKQTLTNKQIEISDIDSIKEKGSNWDDIVK
tara:strand:- start:90 stop:284 length:195 start_codon:yes stop_codon:yes gene_type:complete